ncbi:MAG: hypothetical protein ACXWUN_02330 [Allosphingosinicella sp.]
MADEDQSSQQGIGCAIGILLLGAFILWLTLADVGMGRGPTSGGASLFFGAFFMIAGAVGIVRELIKKLRKP